MQKKAIVLLSGGQDSTTCLAWAVKKWGEDAVMAIGFDYGQKHKQEIKQAMEIAATFGVPYELVDIKGALTGSSLTDHSLDHNQSHSRSKDLPASFTAGRNALFLTIAASRAYTYGINDIVTGVCQTDYSGYPDCREIFIIKMQTALEFAMDHLFVIHTPLMRLTKAETWKLAKDLGDHKGVSILSIVQNLTMTDYNGDTTMNEWGMGKLDNPASVIREKGFREAKERGWI